MTPSYYILADGRDFDAFAHAEITPYLERLDKTETHFVLAALEYLFRQGRKPGTGADNERKQEYRWIKAKLFFLQRMQNTESKSAMRKLEKEFDDLQKWAVSLVVAEREKLNELEGVKR